MPAFWKYWDAARDAAPGEQTRLFDKMLLTPHAEVYQAVLAGTGRQLADRIPLAVENAKPVETSMRGLSAQLSRQIPAQLALFRTTFPDFRCTAPIYFLFSANTFSGDVREIRGQPALMFGIDMIALVDEDIGPLVIHELFHVHHDRLFEMQREAIFWTLWREGLASYVSQRLSGGAADEACCLPNAARVEAALGTVIAEVLGVLDSHDPKYRDRYFVGGRAGNVPDRAGYYLGYLVASRLGEEYTLQQLAAMPPPTVRSLVRQELRQRLPRHPAIQEQKPPPDLNLEQDG